MASDPGSICSVGRRTGSDYPCTSAVIGRDFGKIHTLTEDFLGYSSERLAMEPTSVPVTGDGGLRYRSVRIVLPFVLWGPFHPLPDRRRWLCPASFWSATR